MLDLNTQAFPTQFTLVNDTLAIVGTYGGTFQWATSGSTLGTAISNAPDTFTVDTDGNPRRRDPDILRRRRRRSHHLVRVTTDGGSTTLGSNVQTLKSPVYIGGVDVFR